MADATLPGGFWRWYWRRVHGWLEPGEFTRRAFLNGRIDLTQAEAVMDMIDADSSQQAQLAIQGIRGSIRRLIEPLSEALLNIIANIEVNIDYPEYEDAEQLTWESVLPRAVLVNPDG